MAFADPQKIKVTASETTLPRISVKGTESEYDSEDGLTKLRISTQNGKRRRHMARVDLTKIIPSVLNSAQNEEASASAYLVVDRPLSGFSNEELRKIVEGLNSWLSATEYSAVKKLIGSES